MGIFFSILSPALFSINNYIDKYILEKHRIHPTVITIYSGFIAAIASLCIIAVFGLHTIDIKTMIIIILSGILTIMTLLPYFKALSLDEASRVVPLFQLVPVIVLVLSFFILGETLTFKQYFGSFFIITSSFILSLEKIQKGMFKLRKAFWYMLLSSFFSALATVLFKLGVRNVDFWQSLPYEGFGIFIGAILVLFYKKNFYMVNKMTRTYPKKIFIFMTVNECIFLLSRYTAFFALSLISTGLVSVLGGFQPFFILLYGIVLSMWFPNILKEVITRKTLTIKLSAVVLIFIGIFLIFQ